MIQYSSKNYHWGVNLVISNLKGKCNILVNPKGGKVIFTLHQIAAANITGWTCLLTNRRTLIWPTRVHQVDHYGCHAHVSIIRVHSLYFLSPTTTNTAPPTSLATRKIISKCKIYKKKLLVLGKQK